MRQATSLLRLLRSGHDPDIESGDLKREFLQLTALLRKIDKLANEELEASEQAQSVSAQPDEPQPGEQTEADEQPEQPRFESNGTSNVFGPEPEVDEDDSIEPVASDWWDDARERPAAASEPAVPEAHEQLDESAIDAGEIDEELTPFVPPQMTNEQPQPAPQAATPAANLNGERPEEDEHLLRWWVTFSGNISLERLSKLRVRLSDSPFTIETRFEEISDGLIVLRVVTDDRVTMQQVDWILRELMDLVGLERDSAILTPQ